ncbi:MAG: uncharacterized protein JWR10_3411 [Rubritepida sp.]|nr:uncharacterized protein [Rubritepida sp.]
MNAIRPLDPPRHGAWMQTASGYCVDLHAPDLEMLRLTEIATSLSRIARFLGHTHGPCAYSVAQHSCHVADLLADQPLAVRRAGLLHDAHEALIGDLPTPVKQLLGRDLVRGAESAVHIAMFARFGLSAELMDHPLIKQVDLIMLATERRDLMRRSAWAWGELPEPASMPTLEPWAANEAYMEFLNRAERLGLI